MNQTKQSGDKCVPSYSYFPYRLAVNGFPRDLCLSRFIVVSIPVPSYSFARASFRVLLSVDPTEGHSWTLNVSVLGSDPGGNLASQVDQLFLSQFTRGAYTAARKTAVHDEYGARHN